MLSAICNLFVVNLNFCNFITVYYVSDKFGGARNKGFAQLRSVSKLHPEVSKLLRNLFEISSSSLIYEEAIIITSGRIKEEIIIISGLPRV